MQSKLSKLTMMLSTIGIVFLSFMAVGHAATAVAPEDGSWYDLLKPVWEAFAAGNKLYAGSLALFAAMVLLKRYAPGKVGKWIGTDAGGAAMALGISFFASTSASLADGAGLSLEMAKSAFMIAVGAAGGYSLLKKLVVEPFLKPLSKKAPAWAQPIFAIVFFLFDKKAGGGAAVVAKAEADGKQAVEEKPATGAEGVTGTPTDV